MTKIDEPDFAGLEVRGAPRDGRVRGEDIPSAAGLLSGRELLALQLLARGYSRGHLAALLPDGAAEVERLERSAREALGVATTEEAVELARRRGLID